MPDHVPADERERALREALAACDLPPDGLRQWLGDVRRRAERHGGRRVYGELLDLLDACDGVLGEKPCS